MSVTLPIKDEIKNELVTKQDLEVTNKDIEILRKELEILRKEFDWKFNLLIGLVISGLTFLNPVVLNIVKILLTK